MCDLKGQRVSMIYLQRFSHLWRSTETAKLRAAIQGEAAEVNTSVMFFEQGHQKHESCKDTERSFFTCSSRKRPEPHLTPVGQSCWHDIHPLLLPLLWVLINFAQPTTPLQSVLVTWNTYMPSLPPFMTGWRETTILQHIKQNWWSSQWRCTEFPGMDFFKDRETKSLPLIDVS